MNLELFTDIIDQYTPTGYEFYVTGKRENYNLDKSINDTMLMVLPNPFPLNWRENCYRVVSFSLWFGKLINIKRTTTETQQHNPYSPLEDRSDMYKMVEDVVEGINTDQYMQVINDVEVTFYDSPDGKSVNRQIWLEVPLTIRLWNVTDFEYVTFDSEDVTFGGESVTFKNI